MLPARGASSGGPDWTDPSLYGQNSDWIATTTAPAFDFQYATSLPGVQQPLPLPPSIASADPELDPLRAAATAAVPVFDHGQSWNLDDEHQGNLYSWPGVPAPVTFDRPLSRPPANLEVLSNAYDPTARPPVESLNSVSLGQNTEGQIAQLDFANQRAFLSPPAGRQASRTPSSATVGPRRITTAQETPSTTQGQQSADTSTTSGKSLSPTSAQRSPTRKRKSGPRSPLSRQPLPKAPFQPNEEEEARRIHMASLSRGGSLGVAGTSQIRGSSEQEMASMEVNLRAAESSMLENLGAGKTPGVLRTPQTGDDTGDQFPLPLGKGFPIQIGSELFRLSGASIMSDSPSYFSRFFEEQVRQNEDGVGGVRTLYIDRDPATFRDICRHLQGYVVQPADGAHFVRLFADAQFYSLPRLISQLFDSETVVQIGGQNFQIPRDIFSGLGDTPNFFSLGFAMFFSTPNGIFPGLHPAGLLRPPPIKPPTVPNRCPRVFSDLLHCLRGYGLTIRDDNHRAELLRDCRYFNLKGLEQKLIVHEISHNAERSKSEIVIRLDDIRQSGISFAEEPSPSDRSPLAGWVHYARPFVDEDNYELILEIADEATKIDFRSMRVDFHGPTKARISKLFQVVANKMNLPVNAPLGLMMSSGGASAQDASPGNTPLSEDRVKIRIGDDAYIILDGDEYVADGQGFDAGSDEELQEPPANLQTSISCPQPQSTPTRAPQQPPPRKRKRRGSLDDFGEWIIIRGQWRLRVQPKVDTGKKTRIGGSGSSIGGTGEGAGMEIVLHAVKLDAVSGQRGRNMMRSFLTSSGS